MKDINQLVRENFETISLSEMDSVKLMDRMDSKYVFRIAQLSQVFEKIKGKYRVLEVENTCSSRYETLYYDTQDLELYHKHLTKRVNRHKIRSRNYVESGINFLEVKLKNSRGRTVKKRIKIDEIRNSFDKGYTQGDFLTIETGYDSEKFYPQFWVNYTRITLVNLEGKERCTIDLNLQFLKGASVVDYSFLVILELKQEKSNGSAISSLMKELGIREGGLSKYCLGVISHNPDVRINSFKPKLSIINKLRENEIYA